MDDAASDLHDLVEAAGLEPPFVLAGASGGGMLVVNYADRYPDQVAGIVLLDVPAPVEDLDKQFPGAKAWRNQENLDYVSAERQLALHPPDLGKIPLRVVTGAYGDSSAKDQSFWLDLSSAAQQKTVQGGHNLAYENTDAVVDQITMTLDAARE